MDKGENEPMVAGSKLGCSVRIHSYIRLACLLLITLIGRPASAQQSGKKGLSQDLKLLEKRGDAFNWEDPSPVKETGPMPDIAHLAGTWKAYNGLFNFNGATNSMNLFKPFVIRITDTTINRSEDAEAVPFELVGNKLMIKENSEQGFVNLLTKKLLVISWKVGANYTRYYYERAE